MFKKEKPPCATDGRSEQRFFGFDSEKSARTIDVLTTEPPFDTFVQKWERSDCFYKKNYINSHTDEGVVTTMEAPEVEHRPENKGEGRSQTPTSIFPEKKNRREKPTKNPKLCLPSYRPLPPSSCTCPGFLGDM